MKNTPLIGTCPLTKMNKTSYCRICGIFGGWIPHHNAEHDAVMRQEYRKKQQKAHEEAWQRELDALRLVPMQSELEGVDIEMTVLFDGETRVDKFRMPVDS